MNKSWHKEQEAGAIRGQMEQCDVSGKRRCSSLEVSSFSPALLAFLERASRHMRVMQLAAGTCVPQAGPLVGQGP